MALSSLNCSSVPKWAECLTAFPAFQQRGAGLLKNNRYASPCNLPFYSCFRGFNFFVLPDVSIMLKQETHLWEEEIRTSSQHNPGDPSFYILCASAAWSLCRLSRCSPVKPEPPGDWSQPHTLLSDEKVSMEELFYLLRLAAWPCREVLVWLVSEDENALTELCLFFFLPFSCSQAFNSCQIMKACSSL